MLMMLQMYVYIRTRVINKNQLRAEFQIEQKFY